MPMHVKVGGTWKEIETKCSDSSTTTPPTPTPTNNCQYSINTVTFSLLYGGDTQTVTCGFTPSHVMLGKRYIMKNANNTGTVDITEDNSFSVTYNSTGYTIKYTGNWVFGNSQYTNLTFVFIAFK